VRWTLTGIQESVLLTERLKVIVMLTSISSILGGHVFSPEGTLKNVNGLSALLAPLPLDMSLVFTSTGVGHVSVRYDSRSTASPKLRLSTQPMLIEHSKPLGLENAVIGGNVEANLPMATFGRCRQWPDTQSSNRRLNPPAMSGQ